MNDPLRDPSRPGTAIRWIDLLERVRGTRTPADPLEAWAALVAFQEFGVRPAGGFLLCGLPHEVATAPETWGPRTPAMVDWDGF